MERLEIHRYYKDVRYFGIELSEPKSETLPNYNPHTINYN
jgi:hypothetical protein